MSSCVKTNHDLYFRPTLRELFPDSSDQDLESLLKEMKESCLNEEEYANEIIKIAIENARYHQVQAKQERLEAQKAAREKNYGWSLYHTNIGKEHIDRGSQLLRIAARFGKGNFQADIERVSDVFRLHLSEMDAVRNAVAEEKRAKVRDFGSNVDFVLNWATQGPLEDAKKVVGHYGDLKVTPLVKAKRLIANREILIEIEARLSRGGIQNNPAEVLILSQRYHEVASWLQGYEVPELKATLELLSQTQVKAAEQILNGKVQVSSDTKQKLTEYLVETAYQNKSLYSIATAKKLGPNTFTARLAEADWHYALEPDRKNPKAHLIKAFTIYESLLPEIQNGKPVELPPKALYLMGKAKGLYPTLIAENLRQKNWKEAERLAVNFARHFTHFSIFEVLKVAETLYKNGQKEAAFHVADAISMMAGGPKEIHERAIMLKEKIGLPPLPIVSSR